MLPKSNTDFDFHSFSTITDVCLWFLYLVQDFYMYGSGLDLTDMYILSWFNHFDTCFYVPL
jgi:hypothetical protein